MSEGAASRRRGGDAPVMLVGIDAQDAAVLAGRHPTYPEARRAAGAVEAEGRCRAAVFQRAAGATVGPQASEGDRAGLTGLEANAGHSVALVVDDEVGAVGNQRPRNRLLRVMVRLLLLDPPHQPRVDQRPGWSTVPELLLLRTDVETAVGAELVAVIDHLRRLCEQSLQHPEQHLGLRVAMDSTAGVRSCYPRSGAA